MKEPATPPQLADDPLPDQIRDHFLERYSSNISSEDAAWLAGLIADFISSNRLIRENDYRLAARKCLRILVAIDQSMVEARDSARQWLTISLALGLPSSCWTNLTEAALARQCGISKMAVSKSRCINFWQALTWSLPSALADIHSSKVSFNNERALTSKLSVLAVTRKKGGLSRPAVRSLIRGSLATAINGDRHSRIDLRSGDHRENLGRRVPESALQ